MADQQIQCLWQPCLETLKIIAIWIGNKCVFLWNFMVVFYGILWWFYGIINWLVVWNMTFMTSPRVGMMIQSDEHIFQGGRYTNQIGNMMCLPYFFGVPQTNPTHSRSETNIDLKPSHCKSYKKSAILHHRFRTFATFFSGYLEGHPSARP